MHFQPIPGPTIVIIVNEQGNINVPANTPNSLFHFGAKTFPLNKTVNRIQKKACTANKNFVPHWEESCQNLSDHFSKNCMNKLWQSIGEKQENHLSREILEDSGTVNSSSSSYSSMACCPIFQVTMNTSDGELMEKHSLSCPWKLSENL